MEDESNEDVSYDRNFLRQQLIPQLKARWPAMAQTAARSMALCAEQEALINELAEADWQVAGEGDALCIEALQPGLLQLHGAHFDIATGTLSVYDNETKKFQSI